MISICSLLHFVVIRWREGRRKWKIVRGKWLELIKQWAQCGFKGSLVTDVFNLAIPCFMSIQARAGVLFHVLQKAWGCLICAKKKKQLNILIFPAYKLLPFFFFITSNALDLKGGVKDSWAINKRLQLLEESDAMCFSKAEFWSEHLRPQTVDLWWSWNWYRSMRQIQCFRNIFEQNTDNELFSLGEQIKEYREEIWKQFRSYGAK